MVSFVRSRLRKEVRILAYHRIVDRTRAYDRANVSASPEEFDRQVRYCKRNYDVIRFADLCDIFSGKVSCPRKTLLFSFDDGFADNYEIAYPILRSHGVSAAFFVATSYIGSKKLFWFDRVGFLLKHTSKRNWSFENGNTFEISSGNQEEALCAMLAALKQLPEADRERELQRLEALLGSSQNVQVDAINLPMNWAQLSEMSKNGMEILSHSHTHPVLAKLDAYEEILEEVSTSKSMVQNEVGSPCQAMAYPVGTAGTIDSRVLSAVEESGYELACMLLNGVNVFPNADRHQLKRLIVSYEFRLPALASILALPEVFAY